MPRYDRLPNGSRVRCYDAGPRWVDRWTVLFEDFPDPLTGGPLRPYGPRCALFMSDHPQHPQGVGLSGDCAPPQTYGRGATHRRVPFASLPPDVQRCVTEYAEE
jgi:hypothetical protein